MSGTRSVSAMSADVARMCKGRTHGGRPLAAAGQGWGVALCLYMCVHTMSVCIQYMNVLLCKMIHTHFFLFNFLYFFYLLIVNVYLLYS